MSVYLRKLQSVRNTAARMVSMVCWCDHITTVLEDLHWLPVSQWVVLLVWKCPSASILLTASLGSERVWGRLSAEGASRVEVVGYGEGVPLPRNIFPIFGLQIATFGALWGYFLQFSGLFWTHTAVAWHYNVCDCDWCHCRFLNWACIGEHQWKNDL